jgi:hypothetical protein
MDAVHSMEVVLFLANKDRTEEEAIFIDFTAYLPPKQLLLRSEDRRHTQQVI